MSCNVITRPLVCIESVLLKPDGPAVPGLPVAGIPPLEGAVVAFASALGLADRGDSIHLAVSFLDTSSQFLRHIMHGAAVRISV